MKYIDAEKLIAEIERRINSWSIRGKNSPVGQGKDTCESRVTELSDLLSFITSLQQEQPEVDLDFSMFAKEMDVVFNLPEEATKNTEQKALLKLYVAAALSIVQRTPPIIYL